MNDLNKAKLELVRLFDRILCDFEGVLIKTERHPEVIKAKAYVLAAKRLIEENMNESG